MPRNTGRGGFVSTTSHPSSAQISHRSGAMGSQRSSSPQRMENRPSGGYRGGNRGFWGRPRIYVNAGVPIYGYGWRRPTFIYENDVRYVEEGDQRYSVSWTCPTQTESGTNVLRWIGMMFILIAVSMIIWAIINIFFGMWWYGGFFIEDITAQIIIAVITLPIGSIMLSMAGSRHQNCYHLQPIQ